MKLHERKRKRPWRFISAIVAFNVTSGNGFYFTTHNPGGRGASIPLAATSSVPLEVTRAMEDLPDDKRRLLLVLSRHAGSRLRLLSRFPCLAEVFVDGRAICVDLLSVDATNEKLTIRESPDGKPQTIDFGQLTSVWGDSEAGILRCGNDGVGSLNCEHELEELYLSHVGRGRSASLTKKQISSMDLSPDDMTIVRKTLKAGENMARLLDSAKLASSLGPAAPAVLCQDSKEGGRFKRFPSVLVAAANEGAVIAVNGGWLVLDRSTRFTTEARKFVAHNGTIKSSADCRIVRKLECLAMGEIFDQEQVGKLDVDVQEVLKLMRLAESPSGAKATLIKLGLWSAGSDAQQKFKASFQPWKSEVLHAANSYAGFLQSNAADITPNSRTVLPRLPCLVIDNADTSFRDDGIGLRPRQITGRPVIDDLKWELLVHIADVSDIYCPFPSISVDHKDDDTRAVLESLHILQEAARTRGYSRYDLPFGPLHLLPPVILQELSLERSRRSVTLWSYIDEASGEVLDSGIERAVIPEPQVLTYAEATDVLNGDKENQALTVMNRLLEVWDQRRKRKSNSKANVTLSPQSYSKGHQLVDRALDLYSHEALLLMGRRPVPWTPGAEAWRGGRVATGVLRRYVDGHAQRQILAVLCDYGGKPLNLNDCKEIGSAANDARNSISNLRSFRS